MVALGAERTAFLVAGALSAGAALRLLGAAGLAAGSAGLVGAALATTGFSTTAAGAFFLVAVARGAAAADNFFASLTAGAEVGLARTAVALLAAPSSAEFFFVEVVLDFAIALILQVTNYLVTSG